MNNKYIKSEERSGYILSDFDKEFILSEFANGNLKANTSITVFLWNRIKKYMQETGSFSWWD